MYAHTDERYDEYFGFTDTEVREMLKYYETEDPIHPMDNTLLRHQTDTRRTSF